MKTVVGLVGFFLIVGIQVHYRRKGEDPPLWPFVVIVVVGTALIALA